MAKKESRASWEKFLHPETLRVNLIAIALFISAYELFKQGVIDKPKTIFTNGFDENGEILDKEYEIEVLSINRSPLYASLLWIMEMGGIDDTDIATFDKIHQHRNELAHELISFVSDAKRDFDVTQFDALIKLLSKIEKWWFAYFEMAVDPEILPDGGNVDDVIPGPIWGLRLMFDIALGNEPEEGYYFNAFRNSNKVRT